MRNSNDGAADPTYLATSHHLPSFSAVSVSGRDILGLIQRTPNKHSTADPLPTWLLKEYAVTITPFITQLIHVNSSISTRRVPAIFKIATIRLLRYQKPGLHVDTADVRSRWPISNPSVLSKNLERGVLLRGQPSPALMLHY